MNILKEQIHYSGQKLPIYSYSNPYLHTFCICLYVRGGSMYETAEENGISHFIEHIVFKNINREMNGELFSILDRLGLDFNAGTNRDLIQFTITGATAHFSEAAEIISKAFREICLSEDIISLERRRILAEIRECDEKSDLDFFSQKKIWKDTPLSRSITGRKKTIRHFSGKHLRRMHRRLFSLNNCFFYLTGCISDENIEYLQSLMSSYELKDYHLGRRNEALLPEDFCRRQPDLHIKKGDSTELSFAFDFYTDGHTEAARMLLYDLLFSGENSRIFQELSEKTGYIYSFDSYMEEYSNAGNLSLSFEISPDRIMKAVSKVLMILNEIKKGENICLDYVLPEYTDNAELRLDSPESLNWIMAYEKYFLFQNFDSLEERSRLYRSVSSEEICRLAQEIFTPEHLTLCYKGKKKDIPKKLKDLIFDSLS